MDKDPHAHAEQTQHSRLLTKKQISDMALGIRELSKKLAQIRLKLHVKNIFILGKAHDETLIKHSRETADWLLTKDANYNVYVPCGGFQWDSRSQCIAMSKRRLEITRFSTRPVCSRTTLLIKVDSSTGTTSFARRSHRLSTLFLL